MIMRAILTVLRVAALVAVLLFAAYWVCVQINAIAYMVGKRSAIIAGTTPPVPVRSDAIAALDVVIGLIFEAIAAVIVSIAVAVAVAKLRAARQRQARRRSPGRSAPSS
jgi:hypothetical protein